jgi:hypothetical protein
VVKKLSRAASLASAFLLGLLAGAMLLIALAVAPFWQSLPPAEFRAWFAANAFRIGRLMIPLGAASALAAVVAALLGRGLPTWPSHLRAAACALGIGAITLAVNEPANERFATGVLTDPETRTLLARWVAWHWVRVALGIGGFAAALHALRSTRRRSGSAPGR